MVYSNNNVNFNGGIPYSATDIENLAKYATGVALTNTDSLGVQEIIGGAAPNLLLQGGNWMWANRKNMGEAFRGLANANNYATVRQAAGFGGVLSSSAGSTLLSSIPTAEALAKAGCYSSGTVDLYNAARAAAEEAVKTGSKDAINKAHNLFAQANQAGYLEKTASSTGICSKLSNFFGITKLNNCLNSLAVKSPVFGKCMNAFNAHGGGAMLLLEGGFELIGNVVPTFAQLGAKSGMKQLGKSAVKTVASVGGWVAGAALGTKIGALIGSVIPGAGTAVGAVVGGAIGTLCSMIGGSLGSRLAKKGAEKVVGKDELVLAQEQQANQLAQAAQADSSVLSQVAGAAAERLEAEGADSEDAQVAFRSLSNISQRQGQSSTVPSPSTYATNPFLAYSMGMTPQQQTGGFSSQDDIMARQAGFTI